MADGGPGIASLQSACLLVPGASSASKVWRLSDETYAEIDLPEAVAC